MLEGPSALGPSSLEIISGVTRYLKTHCAVQEEWIPRRGFWDPPLEPKGMTIQVLPHCRHPLHGPSPPHGPARSSLEYLATPVGDILAQSGLGFHPAVAELHLLRGSLAHTSRVTSKLSSQSLWPWRHGVRDRATCVVWCVICHGVVLCGVVCCVVWCGLV